MTQEEEQLLLKGLSSRLPYENKCMTQEEKELYNAANAYAFDLDEGDLNTNRDTFIAGAEWMRQQIVDDTIDKIEKKRKEWSLGNSAEAKYKVEAYDELIEMLKEEKQ